MANGDKKWWQIFKKEEPVVTTEESPPQEPEKYDPDQTMDPKDYFNYHRDKVISDERFNRLDDEGRKKVLGKFFDVYGKSYLDEIGMSDKFDTFKDRWVNETFEKHRVPEIAPKKKEGEQVKPESEWKNLINPNEPGPYSQYEKDIFPAVSTYVAPTQDFEADKQVKEHRLFLQKEFPNIYNKLVSDEDFAYLKSNPGYFRERGEESVKELNKWLKKNTELTDRERRYFIDYAFMSANDIQVQKLHEDWAKRFPGKDLNKVVGEAAVPFVEDYEPGTFLDPKTDERVMEPKTDEAAEYKSLVEKNVNELLQKLIDMDVSNPLYELKNNLNEEYDVLEEEGGSLEQIVKDAEEWASKSADMTEDEYLLGYSEWMEKYEKAYNDYTTKLENYNAKVDEYNKKLEELPKQVPNNKTVTERLKDATNDAYLEWQYWEERFNNLHKANRGEIPSIGKPSSKTLMEVNRMRYNAKAKFEAATRMLYNQEGPTSVDKDWGYMGEVFGNNLVKSLGMAKAGEELSYYNDATEQEILMAMNQIGHEIGIKFTPEEKESLETTIGEGIVAGAGHLLPDMIELVLLGRAAGLLKDVTGLKNLRQGYKIIKNKVLGKAKAIGLKDPIPTGWSVVREFKPTNFQKIYGFIAESIMDEAVFAGVGGFDLGAITGMNTAHLVLPDIKFKGRLQALNPILDIMYKAGIGTTIGMEAGAIGSELISSMFTDKKFEDAINELYPNAEETSKRLLQNYVVNSFLFGGMGLVTTGMAKQGTAPMGAKFDKFGQANWTAYFSPVMRDKVFKAAKDFEARGYPDAARELYTWLDLTKDPVTADQMKEARMINLEEKLKILPIGHLRELRDLHGEAIRMLEYQGRQPDFDGTVELPIRGYNDVKLGSVISERGKYYEVTAKETTKAGVPVKFETVDVETGEPRTFEFKDGKFEFDPTVKYKLNHPLEIPQRLEAHYETVTVLDKIIKGRGRYGEQFKLPVGPPPPEALGRATGEIFVKPPEPTKIEKKLREIEEQEEKMREETGKEPIEMPEYFKKEYSYGDPEKVTEIPINEFNKNIQERQAKVNTTQDEYQKRIDELEAEKAKLKGREKLKQRKALQEEIDRLTIAISRVDNEFQNEIAEWIDTAKPLIEGQIKERIPDVKDEELDDIMADLWQIMMQPTIEDLKKDIGTILNELIDEKTTEGPGVAPPVQPEPPPKGPEVKPQPPEKKPEEKEIELTPFGKEYAKKKSEWLDRLNELADEKLFRELKVPDMVGLIKYFERPSEWEGKRKIRDTGKQILENFIKDDAFKRVHPLLKLIKEYLQEKSKNFGIPINLKEEEPKGEKEKVEPEPGRIDEIAFINTYKPGAKGLSVPQRVALENNTRRYFKIDEEIEGVPAPIIPENIETEEDFAKAQMVLQRIHEFAISNMEEARDGRQKYQGLSPVARKEYMDRWAEVANHVLKWQEAFEKWYDEEFVTGIPPETREGDITSEGEKMRETGTRTINGVEYKRQDPIKKKIEGDNTKVRFSKKLAPQAKFVIMEAKDIQPSHLSGQENPRHFIPEAQPRNRGNLKALADAAREKAQNLDPEQLGYSPNAYTGAPVVNTRGEVIQGNGRAEAILYYYSTTSKDPKGYKSMLMKAIDDYGIEIEADPKVKFEEPVLVRMLDVDDETAINLGSYGMKDLEDVSEGSADIKQASNRLTKEQGVTISNILLKGNEADDTLNDLIRKNAGELIQKLTEFDVFSQGGAEKFRKGGEITPEGTNAIEGVIKGLFFKGGNVNLPEIFEELPHVVKKGIEKSMPVLLRIPEKANILPSVRNALMGLYEYAEFMRIAGETGIFNDWVAQTTMFEKPVTERYNKFELNLIKKLGDVKRQGDVIRMFMEYENLVKGKKADLFEGEKEGISREEATQQVFGEEYQKTIDDEYETKAEPEVKKPGEKPKEGEGTEEEVTEPEVKTIDFKDDLNQMKDLLGDLDFEEGLNLASGGEVGLDPRTKMLNVGLKLVDKFIKGGKYRFDQIIAEIIPAIEVRKLNELLPFLKQAYASYWSTAPVNITNKMDVGVAKEFDARALDELIGKLNEPEKTEEYKDLMGKIFYVPEIHAYVEVDRIEEWQNPEDAKIQAYGGSFENIPDQFEKIAVGVLKNPIIIGFVEKKAVIVDRFRKLIERGGAIEIEPYDNPQYRNELNKVIDIYKAIGDNEKVKKLESQLYIEPRKPSYHTGEWSWEKYVNDVLLAAKRVKQQEDILSGKIMYDPIDPPPLYTVENALNFADSMVKRGEPISIFIKKYLPQEVLLDLVDLVNEHHKILAKLGFTGGQMMETYYLNRKFFPSASTSALYPVGVKARAFERGRKGATLEKVQDAIEYLKESIKEDRENHMRVRERSFVWDIKNRIWKGHRIDNFQELVSIASEWGITSKEAVREQAELALVEISKVIAKDGTLSSGTKYSRILSAYNQFPTLSYRTNEIKEKQQYSTPTPIAFLMGKYTNAEEVGKVLDPSAGNGSLLITAQRGSVRANEINDRRYWNLIDQGYRTHKHDSTHGLKNIIDADVDALHINPPFGGPKEEYNGYPMTGEYVPVAYALESLRDNGKAAIIVGGHIEFKENGQMKGKDLYFFNWLNKYFNVEDVIQIPGDFYKTMGASYPIKLILVNGRKAAPEGAAPLYSEKFEPIESWNDLESRVSSLITKPNEKSVLQPEVDAKRGDDSLVGSGETPEVPDPTAKRPDAVDPGETGEVVRPDTSKPGVQPDVEPTGPDPGEGRRGNRGPNNEPPVIPKPDNRVISEGGRRPTRFGEIPTKRDPGDLPVHNIGKPDERIKRELGLTERTGDEVTPYVPLSKLGSGNFIVPASIAVELEDALIQLHDEIGDVDQYVMDKLKYNSIDEMKKAFFAEQVDGIAQAVFNIESSNAMIIGHQTGTGKGRIAGGVISYAIENGKLPIFITKSADLFTDIYRDLIDIGRADYKPFIMNKKFSSSGQKVKVFNQKTGEVIAEVDEKENFRIIGTKKQPGNYQLPVERQIILTTYSQFTTEERDDSKKEFLNTMARHKDVIFIMDESHEASGQSNTGQFFMDWLQMVEGGIFLSATYAKRPDNMPIYSMKTVMKETNMDIDDLVEAIRAGGPALQEIITLQLAEAGEFSKIGFKMDAEMNYLIIGDEDPTQRTYNPELGKEMVAKFDKVTSILREIIQFQQDYVNPVLSIMNDQIKKAGKQVSGRKGTSQAGISNSPYFSRVWSIIDQLLLSIKVKDTIPLIVEDLNKGLKPVVALKSTMEAMFNEMVNNGELEKRQTIPLDFSYVFKRGMNTVMKYTEKDEEGNPDYRILSPEELTEAGRAKYYDLMEKIQRTSTDIPISPIDILRKGITDAGFEAVEITGRGTMFDLSEDMKSGTFLTNDRGDKIKALRKFNNNPGVAAIINRAGSTGISMHSSPEFEDISQRSMYILQNDLDINVVIQILGRVYRADQTNKPIYNILTSKLPAEMRMFMMNAKKLKSLDANTSGNQKQSKSIINVPDFLNKYGDEVVYEFLIENPTLNMMIGDPLNIILGSEDKTKKQDAAHKITGKIQILPSEMQDAFNKEVIERYEQLIDYLNSTGQNDLMVTSEDLKAEIKEKEVTIAGQGGWSSFGDDTVLNVAEVDVLRKPFNKKELDEILNNVPEDHVDQVRNMMARGIQERADEQVAKVREDYEEKRKAARQKVMEREGLNAEEKEREYQLQKETLDEHEDFRIKNIERLADENMSMFHRYLNYFYPGRVVEVPFTDSDQLDLVRMNKGVFISFDVNTNKPNPWVPSNFQLKFATTDSRKMFRIPASKSNHLDAIIGNSYSLNERDMRDILENWDQQKKARTREIRYIVTQNVLQGMNMYKKGRLIQFTKKDGTVDKGILMPENWIKPDNNVARLPIKKAYNIIRALTPQAFVESYNGDILIKKLDRDRDREQQYELRVPASSNRGKQYYSNDQIKDLVNDGFFEQRGDRMVAIFQESVLQDLLDVLSDRFKIVLEVDSHKVQKGQDSTDSYQTMDSFGAGPSKPIKRGGLTNPYNTEVAGLSSPTVNNRIPVSPITGGTPKKIWEIQLDLTKVTGHKVRYVRKPSRRKKAIGTYYPGSGRVAIKFQTDLDTTAHEMGHALDDLFGLLGPEAQPIWSELRSELKNLWDFGSKPPKSEENPEEYQMREGMAEFIRAFVMNPAETKRRFPVTYNWFKGRISQDPAVWEALKQFSNDLRTWWGGAESDEILSQLHLEPNLKTSPWVFRRENERGQFRITFWDRASRRVTNMLNPLEVSYRWAMRQKGIDIDDPNQLDPSQNFEIVARLHLGLDVKMINMMEKGLVNFEGERIIDEATKKPLSFNLLMEQLPMYTWKDMNDNMAMAIKYGLAERIMEIPWKMAAFQIRKDMAVIAANFKKVYPDPSLMRLPPISVLDQHPYNVEKFMEVINGILTMIEKGELNPEDVFLEESRYDFRDMVIIGIGHDELRDWDIAKAAVEEYHKLKTTDPDKYRWISEFNRVYRAIASALIDYIADAELISEESRDQIHSENLFYMQMKRLFALDPKELVEGREPTSYNVTSSGSGKAKGLEPKTVIHPIKGSHKALRHPVETLIESWMRAVESAELNYVVKAYAQAFSPKFYNRNMYEGPPPKTGEIAWVSKTPEPNCITFFEDGKRRYLVIREPEVFAVFKDVLPETMGSGNVMVRILAYLPQLLRKSIVVAPPFIVRNITRDIQQMLIVGTSKRYLRPQDLLPDKEMHNLFELMGAGQFGHLIRSKRDYYRIMKEAMFRASKDNRKWVLNPVRATKVIGSKVFGWMAMSERPVRMLQFKAAIREGKMKYKLSNYQAATRAAFLSRDLLDFMVGGTWVKELNNVFIFTNAAVRGLDKIFRSFRKKPTSTTFALLIMSIIPSILNSVLVALFANKEDKEEYLNQPDYLRDMFYRIPLANGWLIIPKPFELGVVGSVFQRATDKIIMGDESAFDREFLNSIAHLITPYDISGIMGGYSGVIAAGFNRDLFRQKHIVPPDDVDMSITLANTSYASKFGKMIQQASDLLTKEESHYLWDARKVDALIQGQLGYYGNYFLKAMEYVLPGDKNRKFTFDLTDTGLWRSDPVYSTPDVQYLLGEFQEHPWLKETEMYDIFNGLLQVYFREDVQKDPAEMEKIDNVIRQYANELRKVLEPVNLYKVDEAKKALKLAQ